MSSTYIQFITVGNNAALTVWRFDTEQQQVTFYDVAVPEQLKNVHFLSAAFTDYLPEPAGTYYIVIGTSDGSVVAFD